MLLSYGEAVRGLEKGHRCPLRGLNQRSCQGGSEDVPADGRRAVGGGGELTPDLLAVYAIVHGIHADDLAALTGVDLPDRTASTSEAAVDMTGLIWDVRRLTLDQVQQLRDTATSMC
ncbi:hypothetical protein [Streptomyces sp. NPDC058623]|uniref:hypothetical protein n=1 Tax=Streptomyces sp. NPDC058623 TaxID=3346563 RepID=UPI00364F9451